MWGKGIFMACVLAIFFSVSGDVEARRGRGEPNYPAEVTFFRQMARSIGPLLGPSHEYMRPKKTDRYTRCKYAGSAGTVPCREYVSDHDGTEWKIVIDRENQYRVIRMFKKGRSGNMDPYATIWVDSGGGERVALESNEPQRYAGVTSSTFASGFPSGTPRGEAGENPIEKAAKELERALGTAVPGKALPPIKLPSFGR